MTASAKVPTLTIGAFARASRLSVKALRLYEQHGLLTPRSVDARTGYRHYHPDQLVRARLIARLREIAMPLHDVADLLAAEDHAEADRRLAFWWAGQEHVVNVRRDLVQSLRADLDPTRPDPVADSARAWPVGCRIVPERLLLSEQGNTTVDQLPAFIEEAIRRLREVTAATSGTRPDLVVVIYHGRVNADSDGPVEVCLMLDPDTDVVVHQLPAGTNVRRQDGHRELFVTLAKRQLVYPDILAAYDHLENRITTDRETASGPPREYYFTDIHAAGPDQPVCDAAIPLA